MTDDRDFIGYGADLPDAQWPGGARIAVNINVNFEGGGERSILEGDGMSEAALNDIGARLGIAEHIADNARTFDVALDPEDLAAIEPVLGKSRDLMRLIGDCGDEYRR